MGDRSVEERLAHLRDDVEHTEPGLQLTDEELNDIEKVGTEGLRLLYGLKAENDSQTINALCDVYEPRLTTILYGKPECERPKRREETNGYDIIA